MQCHNEEECGYRGICTCRMELSLDEVANRIRATFENTGYTAHVLTSVVSNRRYFDVRFDGTTRFLIQLDTETSID